MAGAKVIQRVIDGGQSLERALEHEQDGFDGNVSALKELSYGGCRHYIFLEGVLSKLLSNPIKSKDRIVHFLLVSALYQIRYMGIPDYALVNETVNSLNKTRQSWAKKLVNGVLRNFIRNQDQLIQCIDNDAVVAAFPRHLYDLIKQQWPAHLEPIISASNQKPPLTLRINQRINTLDEYEAELKKAEIGYAKTPDSKIGLTLDTPVAVSDIPGFAEGKVSVQDESAQLILAALELSPGQRVLDGCAAPGGKTCLMLESQPDIDKMIAIDLPDRIVGIEENLQRLKLKAQVIAEDVCKVESWWDGRLFDRILLDVPCSGSGVIRRHPDIKHRRRKEDIQKFSDQQLQILNSVWPLLGKNGRLLYVTCSIFEQENDHVIERFLDKKEGERNGETSDDKCDYELQSPGEIFGLATRFGRQRLPGVHTGDGFYYACIKKI